MDQNRYAPPNAPVDDLSTGLEYAGFWIRTGAALIDAVLIIAITYPVLYAIYGSAYFAEDKPSFIAGPADFIISWVLPAVASIAFWLSKQATPGKMALSIRIVDAKTGGTLSVGQSIGRYLAYFVSMIPLGLGFIWVGIDARKQGWHDKLSGAVVVRPSRSTGKPVTFDQA
jgi:uncharacterized RDD family membrane protein YckC